MNKKMRLLTVMAIFSAFLLALGSSDSESSEPTKVEPSDEKTEVEAESEQQETFKVGETVKMGDLEFTVNEVRTDEGGEWNKPEEGNVFLIIDATIVNAGEESETLSSLIMFKLYDSEFYEKDMSIFADTKGSLGGELGAGRTMRGEIAFEVGKDETEWEFIFEPNVFGFGQAIYELKTEDM